MSNTNQFVPTSSEASMLCCRCRRGISSGMCVLSSDERLTPNSIGLGFFHQEVNSVSRQQEKETALTGVLNEIRCDQGKLVNEVTQLLERIQKFYNAPDTDFMNHRAYWAEVFAKDACYIIQFFTRRDHMEAKFVADIFILSNQIPLFLLVKIMKMYGNHEGKMREFVEGLVRYQPFQTLCPLLVSPEHNILNFLSTEIDRKDSELSFHLLHLLHKSIANFLEVPITHVMVGLTTPRPSLPDSSPLSLPTDVFKCLKEYNITFRERIGKVWFHKCLIFSSILYLPSISLEDDTILFHRSLMAFEQRSSDCNLLCDLTFLLHLIVDDSNRELFSKARIIRGTGERFCTNLNDIVHNLIEPYIGHRYDGGVYRSVIVDLDKHTQDFWNEWMYRARDWVILLGLLALFATIFFGVVNEIRK